MAKVYGTNNLDVLDGWFAIALLQQRHQVKVTKTDPAAPPPIFSNEQVEEAQTAVKGLRALLHSTSIDQLSLDQRKALSAFSLGASGFMLAPDRDCRFL